MGSAFNTDCKMHEYLGTKRVERHGSLLFVMFGDRLAVDACILSNLERSVLVLREDCESILAPLIAPRMNS
ncbi:MAG: hypothetical protein CMM01_17845 [Rhodopirellula sp.]|nr:hypothetical protein [Rhodopirellula sp.]